MCQAVRALRELRLEALSVGHDPESLHGAADAILLAAVHPEVRQAYERVKEDARWWASA
jgi:hypothetical protein